MLQAEVRDIDVDTQEVVLDNDRIRYDHLILATGATDHYFGHDAWAGSAPGLKTIEDATAIRAELLKAFEEAEREGDTSPLTFAIVGGGPTGVELAGAIGELAHHTLRPEFSAPSIPPRHSSSFSRQPTGCCSPTPKIFPNAPPKPS